MISKPGDELTSALLNLPIPRAVFGPGSGITATQTPWGQAIDRTRPQPIYATLSGSGPNYSFTQASQTGSGWTAGPRTGTAYEVNRKAGLAGKVIRAYPDSFGAYRFQWIARGKTTAPPAGTTLPNCYCPTAYTLSLTANGNDPAINRLYNSCTIQYGPPPPSLVALFVTANVYTSTQSFYDDHEDSYFYYWFRCYLQNFYLGVIYPDLKSNGGGPYRGGDIYGWNAGQSPNTCTPFNLTLAPPPAGGSPPQRALDAARCAVATAGTQVPPSSGPGTDPPHAS